MRLFIAYRLPEQALDTIAAWQKRALTGVASLRFVPRENLHVTLAFLGSRSRADVPRIAAILESRVREAPEPAFRLDRYWETARVGMLELRDDLVAGDPYVFRGSALTGAVMLDLEAAGLYRREHRAWRPHATVARFKTPPGLAPERPALAPFQPTAVALFESATGPDGSVYHALEEAQWRRLP
jgi:RNA 2',3'-cyclic 3'-phosphodiesterase